MGALSTSRQQLRRWLIGGAFLLLTLWLLFFDSHSLLQRYRWHQELDRLTQENQQLREDIEGLNRKLNQPLSDSLVEHIAREEYGMKHPDETVYRVAPK